MLATILGVLTPLLQLIVQFLPDPHQEAIKQAITQRQVDAADIAKDTGVTE